MRYLKKSSVFGLLVVFLMSQAESVKSIYRETNVSYVAQVTREQLADLLKSSIAFDKNLTRHEENITQSKWREYDEEVERIRLVVENQGKLVVEKLQEANCSKTLDFTDKVFELLTKFRDLYKRDFIDCLVDRNEECLYKEALVNHWFGEHEGVGRMEFYNFIEDSIVRKDGISNVILLASNENDGISPQWSGTESVQNTIYNLHKYIRGVVIQMFRMILNIGKEQYLEAKEHGWENSTDIWNLVNRYRDEFKEFLIAMSETTQAALNKASRDIFSSDPMVHVKGVTYDRLTRFVSAALVKKRSERVEPSYSKNYHQNPYEPWRNGNLRNCTKFFPIVHSIWINETDQERIYHHWDATNTKGERLVYGKYSGDNRGLIQHSFQDDRNFLVRLFTQPKNEFELCWVDYSITDDYSIRKFSNLPVKASSNKVVTGIRWTVKDQIVYLQIQEGKLIRGAIDPTTVSWKKIIEDPESYIALDFYQRSFNLDDVILPEGWFVNGVQFKLSKNEEAIELGVFGGRANNDGYIIFPCADLLLPETYPRQEIMLDEPDVSENAPTNIQHRIVGEPGKHYVKFQPADLKKDGGQTTVPYLDIQSIVTNPPAPISGIGTYYKEMTGYGGFVGLKLISADIISLIKNERINEIFEEARSGN